MLIKFDFGDYEKAMMFVLSESENRQSLVHDENVVVMKFWDSILGYYIARKTMKRSNADKITILRDCEYSGEVIDIVDISPRTKLIIERRAKDLGLDHILAIWPSRIIIIVNDSEAKNKLIQLIHDLSIETFQVF